MTSPLQDAKVRGKAMLLLRHEFYCEHCTQRSTIVLFETEIQTGRAEERARKSNLLLHFQNSILDTGYFPTEIELFSVIRDFGQQGRKNI